MPENVETLDEFMTPAVAELLQLAVTGCLKTLCSLSDNAINIEFRLERPHDPHIPFSSLSHAPTRRFGFGDAFAITRMAASLGRYGAIDLVWPGQTNPLWQEMTVGAAAVTQEGCRALSRFWAPFDPPGDNGDSGPSDGAVWVKADWLVSGNIVCQSPSSRPAVAVSGTTADRPVDYVKVCRPAYA